MTNYRTAIITDLDQSDTLATAAELIEDIDDQANRSRKMAKKRGKQKVLRTISGNFTRRSKSCECRPDKRVITLEEEPNRSSRATSYFHELVSNR